MPTYAIGDVQGCRVALDRLLSTIEFTPGRDRLWFAGDLVNRGPDSLGVLRLVRSLGDDAVVVLGNHDLHLLGRALGVRRAKRSDTLSGVLRAADRDDLVEWLRRRPLAHHEHGHLLVHAGLAPRWTAADAVRAAHEVERALRGSDASWLLAGYARKDPWPAWSEALPRRMRLHAALCYLTRVRCLRRDGTPDDDYTGPPEEAGPGRVPWYEFAGRRATRTTILFGHWAAHGARAGRGWVSLDDGCVWGGALAALRIDDHELFRVSVDTGGIE